MAHRNAEVRRCSEIEWPTEAAHDLLFGVEGRRQAVNRYDLPGVTFLFGVATANPTARIGWGRSGRTGRAIGWPKYRRSMPTRDAGSEGGRPL